MGLFFCDTLVEFLWYNTHFDGIFVALVNGWKPSNIVTNNSISYIGEVLDPSLLRFCDFANSSIIFLIVEVHLFSEAPFKDCCWFFFLLFFCFLPLWAQHKSLLIIWLVCIVSRLVFKHFDSCKTHIAIALPLLRRITSWTSPWFFSPSSWCNGLSFNVIRITQTEELYIHFLIHYLAVSNVMIKQPL